MNLQKCSWCNCDENPDSGVRRLIQSTPCNSKKSRIRSENMRSCRKQLLPLFNASVESTATQTEATSSQVNFNNAIQIKHISDEWMAVSFPKFVYDMPPTVGPNSQKRVLTFLLVDPGDPKSGDLFEPSPFSEVGTLMKYSKTTVLIRKDNLNNNPGPTKSEVNFNKIMTGSVSTSLNKQAKSVPNNVADEPEADEPTSLNEDKFSFKFLKKMLDRNDHLKNDADPDKSEIDSGESTSENLNDFTLTEEEASIKSPKKILVRNDHLKNDTDSGDSTSEDHYDPTPFSEDEASIKSPKKILVRNDHLKNDADSGDSTSEDLYDPTPFSEDEASIEFPKKILVRNDHLKNDTDPDKLDVDFGDSTLEDLYDPTPFSEDEASIKSPKKILVRNDHLKNDPDSGDSTSEDHYDPTPFSEDEASIEFPKKILVKNDHLKNDTDPDKLDVDFGDSTLEDLYDLTPFSEDEASIKSPKKIFVRNDHLKNDADSGDSTSEDLTPFSEDEASIKSPKKILDRNDHLENNAGPIKSEINFDELMSGLLNTSLNEQAKSVPNIAANEPRPSTSLMYGKRIRAVGPVAGQTELFNAQRNRGIGRSIGNNVFRRDHSSCSHPRMTPRAYQPSPELRDMWSSMQRSVRPDTQEYHGPVRNQRSFRYQQPRKYLKPLVESSPRGGNSGNKKKPI